MLAEKSALNEHDTNPDPPQSPEASSAASALALATRAYEETSSFAALKISRAAPAVDSSNAKYSSNQEEETFQEAPLSPGFGLVSSVKS